MYLKRPFQNIEPCGLNSFQGIKQQSGNKRINQDQSAKYCATI